MGPVPASYYKISAERFSAGRSIDNAYHAGVLHGKEEMRGGRVLVPEYRYPEEDQTPRTAADAWFYGFMKGVRSESP
jgi:hypothetical protein